MKVLLDIKKHGKGLGNYTVSGLGFHLVHLSVLKDGHMGIYIVTDEVVGASLKQVLKILEIEMGRRIYLGKEKRKISKKVRK